MKVVLAILKQEAFGIAKFSFPIILFAHHAPFYFYPWWGQLMCSCAVGFYVFYTTYTSTHNSAKLLQFSPTNPAKETFHKIITECNLDPQSINLHYGYSAEGLAMTMFNTISIDPLIFQELENDPEARKAKDVLEMYLVPKMSELQKKRIDEIKQLATMSILPFILKHELGHVYHNYSFKKTVLMGVIGALSAFSGISTAIFLFPMVRALSILIGMIFAGFIDLLLTYGSNYFFKMPEEKSADLFAARYCTAEELNEVADFFEKHQDIVDSHKEPDNLLAKLPSVFVSGHLHGKVRAQYLREIIRNKQSTQQRIA